jgi:transposase-like protein
MAKKSKRGTRYTSAQKAKILAAAKKEGLTGAQVAKRFGVWP